MRPLAEKHYELIWKGDFPKHGIERFREHNEEVRRVVKGQGRDLLEYWVGDGWGPLAEFLGVDVPEGVEYPRRDDWLEYKEANRG